MKISLNLHENSLDFFIESLEDYFIADENGTHQQYHANYDNKIKWKMAFINLVQSTELLMKEIISMISPNLIQSNIDSFEKEGKSISFTQCIARLVNFSSLHVSGEDIECLRFSAKLRNAYIHYNIEMESEKIKVQYSLLLAIYKKLYEEQFGKILTATKATQGDLCSIAKFASEFTIFRGFEIRKSDASDYKEDILLAQRHPSFTDKNGGIVPRIKFGAEKRLCKDIEEENCESNYISEIYLWEYCDDCGAKKDEYHLYHCDLEQCPICGRQALSCDCNMVWSE